MLTGSSFVVCTTKVTHGCFSAFKRSGKSLNVWKIQNDIGNIVKINSVNFY